MDKATPNNFEDFPYDTEQLRITKKSLSVRVNVISGKDGDFWVCISPSLNVSGYGKTIEEARKSFSENMEVFSDDILDTLPSERNKILRQLGWKQKKYFKRQFSKAYVDEDGILQNLEQPRLISLETIA